MLDFKHDFYFLLSIHQNSNLLPLCTVGIVVLIKASWWPCVNLWVFLFTGVGQNWTPEEFEVIPFTPFFPFRLVHHVNELLLLGIQTACLSESAWDTVVAFWILWTGKVLVKTWYFTSSTLINFPTLQIQQYGTTKTLQDIKKISRQLRCDVWMCCQKTQRSWWLWRLAAFAMLDRAWTTNIK